MNIYQGNLNQNGQDSPKEGKYHESIQSNATPDPGHHIGKLQKHKKHYIHDSKRLALSKQVTTRTGTTA